LNNDSCDFVDGATVRWYAWRHSLASAQHTQAALAADSDAGVHAPVVTSLFARCAYEHRDSERPGPAGATPAFSRAADFAQYPFLQEDPATREAIPRAHGSPWDATGEGAYFTWCAEHALEGYTAGEPEQAEDMEELQIAVLTAWARVLYAEDEARAITGAPVRFAAVFEDLLSA